MDQRRTQVKRDLRTLHPLVEKLTGEILKEVERQGITREELGKRARRNASILYGWRNGTRKSPSLLVLQDFADAVGLTLAVCGPTDSGDGCGRSHMASDFEEQMIALVRALTREKDQQELIALVAKFVVARTGMSRPTKPPED